MRHGVLVTRVVPGTWHTHIRDFKKSNNRMVTNWWMACCGRACIHGRFFVKHTCCFLYNLGFFSWPLLISAAIDCGFYSSPPFSMLSTLLIRDSRPSMALPQQSVIILGGYTFGRYLGFYRCKTPLCAPLRQR
jgi:hypothetical protein